MIVTFTDPERAILLAALDREWNRLEAKRAGVEPPHDLWHIERQQQITELMDRLR